MRRIAAGALVARNDRMAEPDHVMFPHADVTQRIIGAFFEVHRELGYGFSEVVYRRAVSIVLRSAGVEALEEMHISVPFRGVTIGSYYADIVVGGVVLVEVKATATIENHAQAQIMNYLKAAGGGVGLLLNFGREATFKRFVMGDPTNSLPTLRQPKS
jgi:GxxExxY protein